MAKLEGTKRSLSAVSEIVPLHDRAERFGTEYREPGKRSDLKEASKKERLQRPGFATGIDLFTKVNIVFPALPCIVQTRKP